MIGLGTFIASFPFEGSNRNKNEAKYWGQLKLVRKAVSLKI
jgi:hypothetical protein